MRRLLCGIAVVACAAAVAFVPLKASAPSGAIFTTLADGSEVNFNIYPSKDAVYLDGGPGPGAPQTAAGLDDGTYVFMVTDPSGKTLLSTDPAICRQFVVTNGIITSVAPSGACAHKTGTDIDHGALTVQLMPYNDTPNNGGVYKVWITLLANYGCNQFPERRYATAVDCAVGKHGFTPGNTKTDNFKVKNVVPVEIDTRFFLDSNGDGILQYGDEPFIDGLSVTWFDTVGSSNQKWSAWKPEIDVNHEAHVEAVENGVHTIRILDQPGCMVGGVHVNGDWAPYDGPQDVKVNVQYTGTELTLRVDVGCLP